MKVGLIGLGKMGFNLGQNLLEHAHEVVAYDVNPAAVQELAERGASGTASLEELTGKLDAPRVLWIMVPHTFVDSVIAELAPLLSREILSLKPETLIIKSQSAVMRSSVSMEFTSWMREPPAEWKAHGVGPATWSGAMRKRGQSLNRCSMTLR